MAFLSAVELDRIQDTPGYGDDLNIMNNIQKMKVRS